MLTSAQWEMLCLESAATEKKNKTSWWSHMPWLWAMQLCYHMVSWFLMFKDATLRGWPTMGQIPACQETIWGSTSHPESQHGLPMLHQLGCWQLSHPPMLCWWSATDFWVLCQEIHGMALPGGSVACWTQCERSQRVMAAFTLASSLTSWCQDGPWPFLPERQDLPVFQSLWVL